MASVLALDQSRTPEHGVFGKLLTVLYIWGVQSICLFPSLSLDTLFRRKQGGQSARRRRFGKARLLFFNCHAIYIA